MNARKTIAATAVLVTALSLTAAQASAESMGSWGKQTKSHYLKIVRRMDHDEKTNNEGAFLDDFGNFIQYGEEHPPPGADRQGFLQIMTDLANSRTALLADDSDGAQRDLTDAQNEISSLPQALPSYWTTGNF